MRYLVTGGGGFIGSHIVDRLLAGGHEVRVLDNFSTGRRENLLHVTDEIDIVEGDITSYERAHRAVVNCDGVFHQAALPSVPRSIQDPLTSHAANSVGTLNLLLAARDSGVGRVVVASSSSVYGANRILPKQEDQATLPISPYAVAKLAGEGFCRSFSQVYGLETVALRYFNVFGPRQDPLSEYAAVVPKFITAALTGQPVTIHGDGEQSRDFTYVENVVEANLRAMAATGVSGRVFNIAIGDRITLNQLVDRISELTGRAVERIHTDARAGDVRDSLADVSAAREALGYEAAVSLDDGLERTIAFHQERLALTI
jgi:nucleoside-diphosphate-sugar epimerase